LEQESILIVDDDEDILTAGKLLFKRHYDEVETCADPVRIPSLLSAHKYSAILLDMNFGPGESSGREGFYWLKEILTIDPNAVVVLITAHGGVDVAVEAMKLGATDFISKPWQNEKVVATFSAAVKLRKSRSEAERLKQTNTALVEAVSETRQPMLGDSPAMRSVLSMIERTAPSDANVLVMGENGTGKELVAREVHRHSNRSEEVFMSVDLGAVTESLFESELFGHVKGAFTDAKQDKIGRIQAAHGGTLFLDEVGNLPLHLQAKLLSVLETRKVTPVGSQQFIDVDVRIVAATNLPQQKLKDDAVFRQDLLFRLNTVEIQLPPLRERREDIPGIVNYYVEFYAKKYNKVIKGISESAMSAIISYDWPGNVRALRHAVERAVILSEAEELNDSDFQLEVSPGGVSAEADANLNLEQLEKKAIQQALNRNRYNISHAAKELGLTRAALYRRMEKHGL
jgi:DNA-binding NtrC family response regulator